jgi:molybdopterin-guanine dinucleotide biosynthesis protein A
MAAKNAKHSLKPDYMHLDKDGELFYYFTDGMTEGEDAPLFAWVDAVARDRDNIHAEENSLAIKVDLPTVTDEMIEWFAGEPVDGRFQVSADCKDRLEVLRKQLADALAKFDKVDYV